MAGLIFDDNIYEQTKSLIKPLISFTSWGTFGATLGGAAGFVVGILVTPDFTSLVGMLIGAAVGSILGNILATTDYSDDKLLALLFISIPVGAILGIGLSIILGRLILILFVG